MTTEKRKTANARKSSAPSRPVKLSSALDRHLNAYTIAAAAAGVTLLACSPAAEAAPVCKTLSVPLFRSTTYPFNPAGQALAPFNIAQSTVLYFGSGSSSSSVNWNRAFFSPNSLGANVVVDSKGLPADLASGALIGPGGNFSKGNSYALMFTYGKGPGRSSATGTLNKHQGNFNFQQNNLFGFEFAQNGKIHYGWARLQGSVQLYQKYYKRTRVTLLGYGYESTPNTAIAAGSCTDAPNTAAQNESQIKTNEPAPRATLGMLARGSYTVALWRTSN